jgi:transcriptional regulator with XRE-family HTH domain
MEAQDVAELLSQGVRRLMAAQTPPWSQVELGRRLGWPQGNVSRLIAAKRPPSATTFAQLATAFGVDVCELLCDAKDDGTKAVKPARKEKK